jgi:hypothetical protein
MYESTCYQTQSNYMSETKLRNARKGLRVHKLVGIPLGYKSIGE